MRTTHRARTLLAAGAIALTAALGLGGCMTAPGTPRTDGDSTDVDEQGEADPGDGESERTGAADVVGPECAAYGQEVPDGPGSFTGMAEFDVVLAIDSNPRLATLDELVGIAFDPEVDLGEVSDGAYTVFAPVDEAFAAVDAGALATLREDPAALRRVLEHHIVPEELTPEEVAGEHETLAGTTITVTGEGDAIGVEDAQVLCGGIPTVNAQLYMIDGLLQPDS